MTLINGIPDSINLGVTPPAVLADVPLDLTTEEVAGTGDSATISSSGQSAGTTPATGTQNISADASNYILNYQLPTETEPYSFELKTSLSAPAADAVDAQGTGNVAVGYQVEADNLAGEQSTKELLAQILTAYAGQHGKSVASLTTEEIGTAVAQYVHGHINYQWENNDNLADMSALVAALLRGERVTDDCEEFAVLTAALLKAAGIDAGLGFIDSDGNNIIDHVVVVVGDRIIDSTDPATRLTRADLVFMTASVAGGEVETVDRAGNRVTCSYEINTHADGVPGDPLTDAELAAQVLDQIAQIDTEVAGEVFRVFHCGLTEAEWNQLLQELRDGGQSAAADALALHPENTPEILNMIAKPEEYWKIIVSTAKSQAEADYYLLFGLTNDEYNFRVMIAAWNYIEAHTYTRIMTTERIMAAEGFTPVTETFSRDDPRWGYNPSSGYPRVFKNDQGEMFVIRFEGAAGEAYGQGLISSGKGAILSRLDANGNTSDVKQLYIDTGNYGLTQDEIDAWAPQKLVEQMIKDQLTANAGVWAGVDENELITSVAQWEHYIPNGLIEVDGEEVLSVKDQVGNVYLAYSEVVDTTISDHPPNYSHYIYYQALTQVGGKWQATDSDPIMSATTTRLDPNYYPPETYGELSSEIRLDPNGYDVNAPGGMIWEKIGKPLGMTFVAAVTNFPDRPGKYWIGTKDGQPYVFYVENDRLVMAKCYHDDSWPDDDWYVTDRTPQTFSATDLTGPPFNMKDEAEAIDFLKMFRSYAQREIDLNKETLVRLGLPEDWDYKTVSPGATASAKAWLASGKMFLIYDPDTGYVCTKADFFLVMGNITKLYNVMALLCFLMEGKEDLRGLVLEIVTETKREKGKSSAFEAVLAKKASAQAGLNYMFSSLQTYTNTHNSQVKQLKLDQARKEAHDESHEDHWYTSYDGWVDTFGFGKPGLRDSHEEALYNTKASNIEGQYNSFMAKNEAEYEQVLGKDFDFSSGDSFGAGIDELLATQLEIGGFRIDVGGGKVDIDRDKLTNLDGTGLRDRLAQLENQRKLWYAIKLALNKFREEVYSAVSGHEMGAGADGLVNSALQERTQFEQKIVGSIVNQIQQVFGSSNAEVEYSNLHDYYQRLYEARGAVNPIPILSLITGPLLTPIANWYVESWWSGQDHNSNFELSDLAISKEDIMLQMAEYRRKMRDLTLTDDERLALTLNFMELKQWQIISQLDQAGGCIQRGSDGYWGLNEQRVSNLRDELDGLQNQMRLIMMTAKGKEALRRMIARILHGTALETGIIDASDLDNILQGRLMALELKLTNLRQKIDQHNKEKMEAERLFKAAIQGILSVATTVAVIAYVAITIVTYGVGALSLPALGFILSLGAMASALGTMLYNYTHPVDQSISQSREFYADALKKIDKQNAKTAGEQVNRLYAQGRQAVDRTGNGSHVDMGSGQWAVDGAAFIGANTELTRLMMLVKFITMMEQGKNDFRNIILAATTGIATTDELDFVKSGLRAMDANLHSALGLKQNVAKDVVTAHNRMVLADQETDRAFVSFCINGVAMVVGGAVGGFGKAGVIQGVANGGALGSLADNLLNLARSVDDYVNADNQLSNQNQIDALIKNIYKGNKRSATAAWDRQEEAALLEMKNDLISNIGGGKITVNSAGFYQLQNRLERIYNALNLMAKVSEGVGNFARSIARALGIAVGRENNTASEAFDLSKSRSLQNLELLRNRVNDYTQRHNQIVDLRETMFVSIAASALIVTKFIIQTLPKIAGVEGLLAKLQKGLNDMTGGKSVKVPWLNQDTALGRATIAVLNGLNQGSFDGKIGVGDLAGMTLNLMLSEQFARYLAEKAHLGTVDKEQERALAPEQTTGASGPFGAIDTLERMSARDNQLLGLTEIDLETFENQKEISEKINALLEAMFVNFIHGAGSLRQPSAPRVAVAAENKTAPASEVAPAAKVQPKSAAAKPESTQQGQAASAKGAQDFKTADLKQPKEKELPKTNTELEVDTYTPSESVSPVATGAIAPAIAPTETSGNNSNSTSKGKTEFKDNKDNKKKKTPEAAAAQGAQTTAAAKTATKVENTQISRVSNAALEQSAALESPEIQAALDKEMNADKGRPPKAEDLAALKLKVLSRQAADAAWALGPESETKVGQQFSAMKKPLQQLINALKNSVKDPAARDQLNALNKELMNPKATPTAERMYEIAANLVTIARQAKVPTQTLNNLDVAATNVQEVISSQQLATIVKSELLNEEQPLIKGKGKIVAGRIMAKVKEAGAELNRSDLLNFIYDNLNFILAELGQKQERSAALAEVVGEIADEAHEQDKTTRQSAQEIRAQLVKTGEPKERVEQPASEDFNELIDQLLGQVSTPTSPAGAIFKPGQTTSANAKVLTAALDKLMSETVKPTVTAILHELQASTRVAADKAERGEPLLDVVKGGLRTLVRKLAQEFTEIISPAEAKQLQQQIVAAKDEQGLIKVLEKVQALAGELKLSAPAKSDLNNSLVNLGFITDRKQARTAAQELFNALLSPAFDPQALVATFVNKSEATRNGVIVLLQDAIAKGTLNPAQKEQIAGFIKLLMLEPSDRVSNPTKQVLRELIVKLAPTPEAAAPAALAAAPVVPTLKSQEKKSGKDEVEEKGVSSFLDTVPVAEQGTVVSAVTAVNRYAQKPEHQPEPPTIFAGSKSEVNPDWQANQEKLLKKVNGHKDDAPVA